MKKNIRKILSSCIAVALTLVMAIQPMSVFGQSGNVQAPNLGREIADNFVSLDFEIAQGVEEQVRFLESFMREPLGVQGFEGKYAITDPNEMVEIVVQFIVPPSVALHHMDAVGIRHNFAVPFGASFEMQALSAHNAFESELASLGISDDAIFASNHQLLNVAFMRVPGYMVESIAALPGVGAVTPNIQFVLPSHEITDSMILEQAGVVLNESNVPVFPEYFMRGPRELYNTDYIHNEMGLTGAGVTVAIIDSGLRHDHIIFAHLLPEGQDMFGGWCILFQTDNTWEGMDTPGRTNSNHGTAVAGGTIGVAPNAMIRAYRVFHPHSSESGFFHIIAEAVERAWQSSDIMNLSLGVNIPFSYATNPFSPSFGPTYVALNLAVLDGMIVTQAAGNSGGGTGGGTIAYPGSISLTWNVGGQTLANQHSLMGTPVTMDNVDEQSSRGPASVTGHIRPDFITPFSIVSAGSSNPNRFEVVQGTSFSAPIAAGIAALMLEQNPGMCPLEMRARVMNTAIRPANLTTAQHSANATGAGRARPLEALRSTAWAAVYTTVPFAYVAGEEVWIDEPQRMGSLSFGFVDHGLESTVLPIVIYDSPSNTGWSYSWNIYTSNRDWEDIGSLIGAELVVEQTGPNNFNVQMVFDEPAASLEELGRNWTGFFYLTYNGEDDIEISIPFSGRLDYMASFFDYIRLGRYTMQSPGGTLRVFAGGFNVGDVPFYVHRDGEYFMSGLMGGGPRSRTVDIAIPANHTGIDQVYVITVPIFEGQPGYTPQTLVVSGYNPGFARVTAVDTRGITHMNLLAFDYTQQAINKWETMWVIHELQDFDAHLPEIIDRYGIEYWEIWDSYRFTGHASGYVLAGYHDMFWFTWGPDVIAGWQEVYFTADTHYIVELVRVGSLNGSGEIRIFEAAEEHVESLTANRTSMLLFGGIWQLDAIGFFENPVEFALYLDGEQTRTGIMPGGMTRRSMSLSIPANDTGIEQVYTFVLPQFDKSISLTVGYEHPGYVTITARDLARGEDAGFNFNQVSFDSSLTALRLLEDGAHFTWDDPFDSFLPTTVPGELYLFTDEYTGTILAGTHHVFWFNITAFAIRIPIAVEFTFQAGRHYHIDMLDVRVDEGDGIFRIYAIDEPVLENFGVNRTEMNALGGDWYASAWGVFSDHLDVDFDYTVTLDGEYFTSGTMDGDMFMRRTATINIPQNTTGQDQIFELRVPALEGEANYEPQILVVCGIEVQLARVTFKIHDPLYPWGDWTSFMMLLDSQNRSHPQITYTQSFMEHYDVHIPPWLLEIPFGLFAWDSYSLIIPAGVYAIHTSAIDWGFWGVSWSDEVIRLNDFEFKGGYHYIFERVASGPDGMRITVEPKESRPPVPAFDIFNNGYGGSPSRPNASLAASGIIRLWTQLDGINSPFYLDAGDTITALDQNGQCAMDYVRVGRVWVDDQGWKDYFNLLDVDKDGNWQYINLSITVYGQTVDVLLVNANYGHTADYRTVTIVVEAGAVGIYATVTTTVEVPDGGQIPADAIPNVVARTGFYFAGWYPANPAEHGAVTEDLTFTARFNPLFHYVTFEAANGGTLVPAAGHGLTVRIRDGFTFWADRVPTPVADDGYEFVEWYPANPAGFVVRDNVTFTALFAEAAPVTPQILSVTPNPATVVPGGTVELVVTTQGMPEGAWVDLNVSWRPGLSIVGGPRFYIVDNQATITVAAAPDAHLGRDGFAVAARAAGQWGIPFVIDSYNFVIEVQ